MKISLRFSLCIDTLEERPPRLITVVCSRYATFIFKLPSLQPRLPQPYLYFNIATVAEDVHATDAMRF
jgi:hypothetical protein